MWGSVASAAHDRAPSRSSGGTHPSLPAVLGTARSLPGAVASRKTRPAGATLGPSGLRPLHPLRQGLPPSGVRTQEGQARHVCWWVLGSCWGRPRG